jgi:ribosomal peptide maturation radical SAM protein 1
MPFADLRTPALGLSMLKQVAAPLDVTTEVLYLDLLLGKRIGIGLYDAIMQLPHYLLAGEWFFSEALLGSDMDARGYLEKVLRRRKSPYGDPVTPPPARLITRLLHARGAVPGFLEDCQRIVVGLRPRLVGFSVIFQQRTASLALAKGLKQCLPDTVVVFGGAGCEGVMGQELVTQFPFVDAAVAGEGETVFPEIIRRVLGGEPLAGVQGVMVRPGTEPARTVLSTPAKAPVTQDMDALPFPMYDDYYRQLDGIGILRRHTGRTVPMESSRGCWWGERSQCTFCGLTGDRIGFRPKSSQRVLEELHWIIEKYRPSIVAMVDSAFNEAYLADVIPTLAAQMPRAALFWEARVKLKKPQVRALRHAGIGWVQPGIESLSSRIMKLLRKGTTAIENIQFLKWCKEYGIATNWNLLWGFPGEPPEEYDRMADLVPLLAHLQPPMAMGGVRLDRFSPYFENREAYGITDAAPLPAYRFIYPEMGPRALANLAYYYTFGSRAPRDLAVYTEPLRKRVQEWRRAHGASDLFFLDDGSTLTIWDERPVAPQFMTELSSLERRLYLACDGAARLSSVCRSVANGNGGDGLREEVGAVLDSLVERLLMIREGSSFLSLAIPVGDYRPRPEAWGRFQTFLKKRAEANRFQTLMARVTVREMSEDREKGARGTIGSLGASSSH